MNIKFSDQKLIQKIYIDPTRNAEIYTLEPYHTHFMTFKNRQTCPVCDHLKTIKPKFDFIANQDVKHEN